MFVTILLIFILLPFIILASPVEIIYASEEMAGMGIRLDNENI